jgi:hypothetical protein
MRVGRRDAKGEYTEEKIIPEEEIEHLLYRPVGLRHASPIAGSFL